MMAEYKEIHRLANMLDDAGIDYEMHEYWDGWQICVPADHPRGQFDGDAIQHRGSYGSEQDLIEVWGFELEDPEGWLTAEDAFKYFKEWSENDG